MIDAQTGGGASAHSLASQHAGVRRDQPPVVEQGLHLPVLAWRRCLRDQFLPAGAQAGQRAGPVCGCAYRADTLPGGTEHGKYG